MATAKRPNHYVDNVKFQEAMLERHYQVKKAREEGTELPRVSEYIGSCLYLISQHLSYSPNFIGYSFRDEMIGDGVENCLRYIDNFDPINYTNPFAYFTQFNFYAFIRRIQKEKKQSAIKNKIIREIPFETFDLQAHDEGGTFANAYMDYLQSHDSFDFEAYEKKKEAKVKKSKKATSPDLTDFSAEVEENIDPDIEE